MTRSKKGIPQQPHIRYRDGKAQQAGRGQPKPDTISTGENRRKSDDAAIGLDGLVGATRKEKQYYEDKNTNSSESLWKTFKRGVKLGLFGKI